jgi:hypothetical protein
VRALARDRFFQDFPLPGVWGLVSQWDKWSVFSKMIIDYMDFTVFCSRISKLRRNAVII